MKYYIIAGEASGDLHGANLMRSLQKQDPEAAFRFWGGDNMQRVGGTPVRHIRDLAYMGFIEVMMHLRTIMGNLSFCKKDILEFQPDAVITIDYPGFNLKIAKFAHQHHIKCIHYISPQLWAWKKGRIKSMRRDLDMLCYILPFEQDFYKQNNYDKASYVGHPLLDAVHRFKESENNSLDLPTDKPIIALLPGSRKQELKKVLPTMATIAERHPEYHFVVAGMSLLGEGLYRNMFSTLHSSNLHIVYDRTYELLSQSHAALVCSGTATLETALFNVPQVVCYSANALSISIAKLLVGNRIKYISLVNLICDAPIVTELLQQDMNDARLGVEFDRIAQEGPERQQMIDSYAHLRDILGNEGASDRAAATIISTINK